MENELNVNELIKIETMPQIFEKLEIIGKWVDDGLANLDLDNLVYDEEHKSEIKKTRTEIKNVANMLEEKRKEIKFKVLEPYTMFEEKYNKEIKEKLINADVVLKQGIDNIESGQKESKEKELKEFFERYLEEYGLKGIINFEDIGIKVTLSSSMKSMKDHIVIFVQKVFDDFKYISTLEHRDEVMNEYLHNGYNLAQSVNTIDNKYKTIDELSKKFDEQDKKEQENKEIVEKVDEVIAPVEIVEEEQFVVNFKVQGTKKQLKELKLFMQNNGIHIVE